MFPCIVLHRLGSLCGFLEELASLDELIAPSGFKKNTVGENEFACLRILWVSKTDNPFVSTTDLSNIIPRISLIAEERTAPHDGTALPAGLAAYFGQATGVHFSHGGRMMVSGCLAYAQGARYALRALCEGIDTRV